MTKFKQTIELLYENRSELISSISHDIKTGADHSVVIDKLFNLLLNEWRTGYVEGIEVMNKDNNDDFYDLLIQKLQNNESKV